MIFQMRDGKLFCRENEEILQIEAWGTDSLRVRATKNSCFSGRDQGLLPATVTNAEITLEERGATIRNGRISAWVDANKGWLVFYKDGVQVLKEYTRAFNDANPHSPALRLAGREYHPLGGEDYKILARFESNAKEKLFGMGQYQQPELDLKGCVLELAPRNSQISIPFCLSNLGYGFLWNNPAIGEATFGKNYTIWQGNRSSEIDYWVTVGDNPKEIIKNYTAVTGRAPEFPENLLGLWQCKLRYRTQEELLEVAREYHRRGIPLDMIVIDFFHWKYEGDWSFDPKYWPDPEGMMRELRSMGTRCMVSIWPTVDPECENYKEIYANGYLIQTQYGEPIGLHRRPMYDATNPDARRYLWEKCRENYYRYGIDSFWLDEAEPEFIPVDFAHYSYYVGSTEKNAGLYSINHAKGFWEGMMEEGQGDIANLLRCAWVGSQRYAAVVWSGDVKSNFETLRDQLSAGLNIGMAGIPWWTTDTGGFRGNITDPDFNELLVRWFQFSTFSPVLRMHGDHGPHDIPRLSENPKDGGYVRPGQPHELWSYGEEIYELLKKYLDIRLEMRPYIKDLTEEASENGSPLMRTMFYEFPNDEHCWELDDQYMFGDRYLVAPVLYAGMRERQVYLPEGKWKDLHTGEIFEGAQTILAPAPLSIIPVYERL